MALMTESVVDPGVACYSDHLSHLKHIYFPRKKSHNGAFKSEKHLIRATAKKYAHSWEAEKHRFAIGNQISLKDVPRDQRRPYLEQVLGPSSHLRPIAQGPEKQPRGRSGNPRHFKATRHNDEVEGRLIAQTNISLPSDMDHKRPPSLGREDAFRDETTSKRSRGVRIIAPRGSGEDEQVAELYEMGLLYDDDEAMETSMAGEVFDLNSIRHEEPVYAIRASKRVRRSKAAHGPLYQPLDLELSFSNMENDELIARLMAAGHDITMGDETPERYTSPEVVESPSSERSATPLRIIYERTPTGESNATVDVDTSQPPDLELDDYDCFSDSDIEIDGVATGKVYYEGREIEDATPGIQETGAWVVLGEDGS